MKQVTWLRWILCVVVGVAFTAVAAAQTSQPTACGWNPDSNGDYLVTVADLLALLSVFEEADADMDGIFDSMDDCVGTYDACGICNGGGVDADADGVCDDVDPCVGALDACGICNGPGPSVPVIDEIVFVTDSIYVPPIQQWYVFSYAVDTLYTYVCPMQGCTDASAANFNPQAVIEDGTCTYGPAQCGGASTVTFDGHTYALVGIGTQCWFKENLRSDNYRNGDAIPGNLTDSQWTSTTSGAQTVYGEGTSTVYQGSSDEVANLATYGRLYNWYAVNDARGLCPVGFHVPSDSEWTVLENALGGSSVAGMELKSSATDSPPWDGANSNGFSASPGGARSYDNGYFYGMGDSGIWWSSTPSETNAWIRYLSSGNSNVYRFYYYYFDRNGLSVRCVGDEGVVCLDPDNDGVCAENEVSGCTDSNATNFNPSATEEDGTCVLPGLAQCGGASTITFDGHTYALVGIGTQCWFKENLRSDNYRNGDAIHGDLDNGQWILTTSGAQAVYDNDSASFATYGRLYNWYAVNDARGLCPVGFHVPAETEWSVLANELGGSSVAGKKLKSSVLDSPPWDGINSFGFSALPSGFRDFDSGSFENLGVFGYFWSSNSLGPFAWLGCLTSGDDEFFQDGVSSVNVGFAIRCVKDEGQNCWDIDGDTVCAEDEVSGCTEINAVNYDVFATENDGSCLFSDALQCGGLSTVTFDGYDYQLIGIGAQCWFKENLRSDNYRNGDVIPGNLNDCQWTSASSGAQAVYGEGTSAVYEGSGDEVANLATYGRLYNWYAVNDARGLCPAGFHVPSDSDWSTLEMTLGMPFTQAHSEGWRGMGQGSKLKATATDSPNWDGSNSSGFSALPGGFRNYDSGTYFALGEHGHWWSSTMSESHAWYRKLTSDWATVTRRNYDHSVRGGFSVRCIKD